MHRLQLVLARDRNASVLLLGTAAIAWLALGLFFAARSPVGDTSVQATGALGLGTAVAITTLPLFWLASFARRRGVSHAGSWTRAIRRAILVGGVVTILVLLRILGVFSLPIALFVMAMALVIELMLSSGR